MIIIPSVDIVDGKTVRLYQGQFDKMTTYDKSPYEMIQYYFDCGYTFIHIVNLDRARNEKPNPHTERMIEKICGIKEIKIQMGGGLRNESAIVDANNLGVYRFVLGTLAVDNIGLTLQLFEQYGKDRFTLSFDVMKNKKDYFVRTHGWQETSAYTLFSLMEEYGDKITHLLCTDIEKDGALSLPNSTLYQEIKEKFPSVFLQASGGISMEGDISQLDLLGIDGVIIGRAIHEGLIDLKKLYTNFGK